MRSAGIVGYAAWKIAGDWSVRESPLRAVETQIVIDEPGRIIGAFVVSGPREDDLPSATVVRPSVKDEPPEQYRCEVGGTPQEGVGKKINHQCLTGNSRIGGAKVQALRPSRAGALEELLVARFSGKLGGDPD